jgi:acyl-coenzyme A thioesterase PaaI-like protein
MSFDDTAPDGLDDTALRAALIGAIPIHQHLGIELAEGRAVRLPDLPETRNHLEGQAGAALFGVAEAASAAVVFGAFGAALAEIFAVPAGASIRFRRPGAGGVVARAVGEPDAEAVLAATRVGRRVTVTIPVTVRDGDDRLVAEADVEWHFGPVRHGPPCALPGQAESGRSASAPT